MRIGAPTTTASPKPVTDSKKGATPSTTSRARASRLGSTRPRKLDTRLTAPASASTLCRRRPPKRM
jgi:hypothetical protein